MMQLNETTDIQDIADTLHAVNDTLNAMNQSITQIGAWNEWIYIQASLTMMITFAAIFIAIPAVRKVLGYITPSFRRL